MHVSGKFTVYRDASQGSRLSRPRRLVDGLVGMKRTRPLVGLVAMTPTFDPVGQELPITNISVALVASTAAVGTISGSSKEPAAAACAALVRVGA